MVKEDSVGKTVYEIYDKTKGKEEPAVFQVYTSREKAEDAMKSLVDDHIRDRLPRYFSDADTEVTRKQIELLLEAIVKDRFEIRTDTIKRQPEAG